MYILWVRYQIFPLRWDPWTVPYFRTFRSSEYFQHSKNRLFAYNDNSRDKLLTPYRSKWYFRIVDNTVQWMCRLHNLNKSCTHFYRMSSQCNWFQPCKWMDLQWNETLDWCKRKTRRKWTTGPMLASRFYKETKTIFSVEEFRKIYSKPFNNGIIFIGDVLKSMQIGLFTKC